MKTAEIFDPRIFKYTEDVLEHMADPELKELWRGEIELCDISVFDYVMAQRLNLVPFDQDRVFSNWLNYLSMGIPTASRMRQILYSETPLQLILSVPVHQDLFREVSVNFSNFYIAFFMQPEPYKICCMQWDAYYQLYLTSANMFTEDSDCYYTVTHSTSNTSREWYARYTNPSILRDTSAYYDMCILCCQNCNPIDLLEDVSSSCYHWAYVTSDIGKRDFQEGLIYNTGEYREAHGLAMVSFPSVATVTPACFYKLRMGESYFEDIFA